MNVSTTHFPIHLERALNYWIEWLAQLKWQEMPAFQREQSNLLQLVRYGLTFSTHWNLTGKLLLLILPFAEFGGELPAWSTQLEQANQKITKPPFNHQLQNKLGGCWRWLGEIERAITLHETAIANTNDKLIQAQHRGNLSVAYIYANQLERAQTHAEQALPYLTGEAKAVVLNLLGTVALGQGKYEHAGKLFQQAIQLWQHHPIYQARSQMNLGITYQNMEMYEQALSAYQQASALLIAGISPLDEAMVILNHGTTLSRIGRWVETVTTYQKIDHLFLQRLQNPSLEAGWLTNLGVAFTKLDQIKVAEEYLQEAVDCWRKIGNEIMLGNALGSLGELYLQAEQSNQAQPCFVEAITLLAKHPHHAWAQSLCQKWHPFVEKEGG